MFDVDPDRSSDDDPAVDPALLLRDMSLPQQRHSLCSRVFSPWSLLPLILTHKMMKFISSRANTSEAIQVALWHVVWNSPVPEGNEKKREAGFKAHVHRT